MKNLKLFLVTVFFLGLFINNSFGQINVDCDLDGIAYAHSTNSYKNQKVTTVDFSKLTYNHVEKNLIFRNLSPIENQSKAEQSSIYNSFKYMMLNSIFPFFYLITYR